MLVFPRPCWVLLVFIGICHLAVSQTITGSVNGTVTDPSGAVVAGAKVTAINIDTNVSTTTASNGSGVYSIRFLQIGAYKVSIEATGFARREFGPFTLEAGQDAKVDVALSVAGESAQISVSETFAPLLNTENATIGSTLDSSAIDNVPLNGRNFSSLTVFVPGAVTTQPSGLIGSNAIERSTGSNGQASINGNRQQTNNFLLDGIEINETINNTLGYNPSPDAIGQVRVISANAQAEYGNVNGGDVIALLKSGTNLFHGSAYTYLENYQMDANTWANKHSSPVIDKSSYTQNIFGGTLGGPLIKDRLFFFGDYSGARYHLGGTTTSSVATALMRQGDFSELLNPALISKPIQLYDSSNGFTAYAGNKNVPIVNPVAAYLYAHPEIYPLPNASATAGTVVQNNYHGPTKTRRYNDQFDVKLDWKASAVDQVFGRYSQSDAGDTSTNPLAITFPGASTYPTKSTAINWVRSISPAIVNEFRAGFTRIRWNQGNPSDTTGAFGNKGNSLIGVPGAQSLQGFSAQNFSTYGTNGGYFTTLGNQATGTSLIVNTFTYGDNLTWQKGKHLFKVGAQFIRYQQNSYYPGNDGSLGNFAYSGAYTSNPGANTTTNPNGYLTNGYALADFNLDRVYYEGQGSITGRTGQRQWRSAFFVQDDYKFLPNLTFNVGIRYEYDQPIYEVNNKQANVNFTTKTVMLAGVNGASRALYNPSYNNLMPRLGFSYSPTTRTVIRGGYGITTYMEGTGANLRLNYNPPFQTSFQATGTAPSATSSGVSFKVENGFTSSGTASSGTTYRAWDVNLKPAFIAEYSLTTEYQLNNSASFSIGYVGESGQHLITAGAANQLAAPCVINGVVSATPNSAACIAVNPAPFYSLVGQSGSVVLTASNAMMNYNAMQATFRQRTSHGLSFTLNYAYGRSMTNSVGFYGVPSISGASAYAENFYDNHREYGPAGQDVRHNINGTAVYELPFGRGHAFGGNMNPILDQVLGGWRVAMTGIVYSGFPITITNSTQNAYTNQKVQRANHLRSLKVVNRSTNHWFGTDASATSCSGVSTAGTGVDNGVCAYATPSNGTFGNARVGSERAPGFQQYDSSLFKDFTIYHEHKISLRVDASNVFNITSLGNPDRTAQSSTFGKITSVRSIPRQLQLSAKYQF